MNDMILNIISIIANMTCAIAFILYIRAINRTIKVRKEEIKIYKDMYNSIEEREGKQKAKKPTVLINDKDIKVGCVTFRKGVKTYKCVCGCWITLSQDYCNHCGQKQDWSVLEDWSEDDE